MDEDQIEILNKSPLQNFIKKFDEAHIKWGYDEYWINAVNQDYRVWNTLFHEEIKFREKNTLNFVWSEEGGQGDGKSMALLRKKQIIDQVYGVEYNIRKFVDRIHFFGQDLEEALSNTPKRSTNVLDEQVKTYGIMSRFTEDQLANYEDTFRRPQKNIGYASPSLRRHEHFFIFEAMGDIYVNEKGEPTAVEVMLKTKRKSDKQIMPRGVIRLKAPEKELWDAYNAKKDDFISKLEQKQGGLMDRIEKDADKVIGQHKERLYKTLKDGTKVIQSKAVIDLYVYKVLGMRAYTVAGYEMIREEIRRKL